MIDTAGIEPVRERLAEPGSRGLANAVSAAIRDGALREGDRLPPIRVVARHLRLSPTTVSSAWALLARAGAIATDGRRGTTVARTAIGPARYRRALDRAEAFELDLSSGVPDPKLLPDLDSALRQLAAGTRRGYLDDPVLPELVSVLRDDWPYPPERFAIVDGAMDALQQITSVLLRYGSTVLVEHPCFPPLLDLLEATGARVVGVRLDESGLRPDEVAGRLTGAAALFLQPRAQNPTGVSMTRRRARELAQAVGGTDLLVVEDDSAGSIATAPAVSLGSFVPDRTLHIRSFSKSHGPDLRIAAVSGPSGLIEPLVERRYLGQGWTSRILQAVLLHHLTSAASAKRVERARAEYARRRSALVRGLRAHGVDAPVADGLNLWLPVRDEAAALVRLASRGIGAAAGRPFMVLDGDEPHLRITAGLVERGHAALARELAAAAGVGAWASPR